MRRTGQRVGAVTIAAVVSLLVGCGPLKAQTAAEHDCARAVLSDWSDGKIDRVYSGNCYLAAIDALPEDLRAYSSASEDITRALQASSSRAAAEVLASAGSKQAAAGTPAVAPSHGVPTPVIVLAGVAGLVAAAGVAGFAVRRLRGETS